ncbi:hypothetical protein HQO42_14950 [Rhodococcus fascians]|nr:hypothetical protein [Rhodococcus fascians]MBY4237752.1 hypothetical protein [Rhodococcus fascians]MBY4253955.1 hypothetical protein [Rhodococcus fascians]MBY4269174.1 hypothetical protein [Rhodococcus fascians]
MDETFTPAVEDFHPGGKYNLSGYLTPVNACRRYYLMQNIPPVYRMPDDVLSLDSWMASDD